MSNYFPYLDENKEFMFPPVENATEEGIVAAGGNLSPGMLISAYKQGIFPWYSDDSPILWWSPDPRCVLFPGDEHISRSMQNIFKKTYFSFSFDDCFEQVISACSKIYRPGQGGTWITDEMVEAYIELHKLGYAHSLEVWRAEELAGGLYGLALGKLFFGESMFSYEPNASKAGFITLCKILQKQGFLMIDCQVPHPHLFSLGAVEISRCQYLQLLHTGLQQPGRPGKWKDLIIRLTSTKQKYCPQ